MKGFSLGFAGTAKNTGKTTALNSVSERLAQLPGICRAYTSIGYDGEDIDNITGLPKPRIHVEAGDLAAVSEACVKASDAQMEILQTTHIRTPLGKVQICRVTQPGRLVVAGPNKRSELRWTLDLLYETGAGIVLVDGALGRLTPMVETDSLILATGASRNPEAEPLARETGCIVELMNLPVLPEPGEGDHCPPVLGDKGFEGFLELLSRQDTVLVEGLLGEPYFHRLTGHGDLVRGKRLLFQDNLKLLLSGELSQTRDDLEKLGAMGLEIGVLRQLPLISITVNPYYPSYRVTSKDYEPSYVGGDALLTALKKSTGLPCFDVVKYGSEDLMEEIFRHWRP